MKNSKLLSLLCALLICISTAALTAPPMVAPASSTSLPCCEIIPNYTFKPEKNT